MTDDSKPVSPVLSRYEAAAYLGVSVDTLDRLRADGAIPASQISRRLVKYRRADLDAYLIACRAPASEKAATVGEPKVDYAAAMKRAREVVRQMQLRDAERAFRRSGKEGLGG